MSEESSIWSFDESIPSQRGAGQAIVTTVLEQLKAHDWSERDVFGVHLALEEALVNAIIHGNGLDAAKQVDVKCRLDADCFRVEVRDQGSGFQVTDVPDPTDEDCL
ncbi:MAG: ATP-binding protein, partial [Planctomycetota bacterium]